MEIERLQNKKMGSLFKPLDVKKYTNIKQALERGKLNKDTELLVFEIAGQQLAFSKHRMAFHHIAQGKVNETSYMLTFCVICNSGMVMSPIVNNETLHFHIAGAYNGMLLMIDKETKSYWDHITGHCLSGEYEGHQLDILHSHQVLLLKEVLEQYPDCLYGEEKMNFKQRLFAEFANWKANVSGKGFLPPGFRSSMIEIDDRLPEMEMGLGIWEEDAARFYSLKVIKEMGNFIIDTFKEKNLIIYISPTTHTPSAMYIDEITTAVFEDDKLSFANGNYIRGGNLYSQNDEKITTKKPMYIFLRWYGFVSTFPDCEIGMHTQQLKV